jgi:hypothetical protein
MLTGLVFLQGCGAGQEGLEPPTAGFGDRCSAKLSYCPLQMVCGVVPSANEDSTRLELRAVRAVRKNGQNATPTRGPAGADVHVEDPPRSGSRVKRSTSMTSGSVATLKVSTQYGP